MLKPLIGFGKLLSRAMLTVIYFWGWMYEDGNGVPQDYSMAAACFQRAFELGDAGVAGILGDIYLEGRGVTPDYAQAAIWYRKAAELGVGVAGGSWLDYMNKRIKELQSCHDAKETPFGEPPPPLSDV
jgi:TPR repeat protein